MKHTYQISGMTCNGCRSHVEQTLKEVPGISDVSVDLAKKEATVHMEQHVPIEMLKEALKNDGGRYDIHPPGTHENHLQSMPEIKKQDKGGSGKYYCPMLCEGDKKYDKPGDCPKCGMDLEREASGSKKVEYTCPMHPEA
jgi:Cu2+-exporting ATPase